MDDKKLSRELREAGVEDAGPAPDLEEKIARMIHADETDPREWENYRGLARKIIDTIEAGGQPPPPPPPPPQ